MDTQDWQDRAIYRVARSELGGISIMNDIIPIYYEELKNIQQDTNELYDRYSNEDGLDPNQLEQRLSGVDRKRFVEDMSQQLEPFDLRVEDLYSPDFLVELTVLVAITELVYWRVRSIEPRSIEKQTRGYKGIIREGYRLTKEDLMEATGKSGMFRSISEEVVEDMLNTRWRNKTYISRTGENVTLFAEDMKKILGEGLKKGISQEKMSQQIREKVDIEAYKSMRLVRTETNYFRNQTELRAYYEEGVESYRYDAVLDSRTSDICRGLDGQEFRLEEASAGENFPPMHPNCRSTTQPIFLNEVLSELT